MNFAGKVALVTGAGSGIGAATAAAFARQGARLILCDVDREGLAGTVHTLGPAVLHHTIVDVGDRAAMNAFADEVHAQIPAVDVLVNNAGVGLAGRVLQTPLADWDWILRINLGGVLHGVHYFVPAMVARGTGHVVNVSSAMGYWAIPGMGGYVTSKFAVYGLSSALRHELAASGVGVSVICPGLIRTRITETARLVGLDDPDAVREAAIRMYQRRNYPPEKAAQVILRAIQKNRFLVPVTPEAWLALFLARWAPEWAHGLGHRLTRRVAPAFFPET